MRGRKPKPSKVQEREGAYAKNPKRRKEGEPEAPDGWPDEPTHLDEPTLDFWRETCYRLDELGILSHVYATAIECYAQTYTNYRKCQERVSQLGPVLLSKNSDGQAEVKRNPYSVELHKYRDALLKYEAEFGLTPSSKSRLGVARSETSELEAKLYGVVG